MIQGVNEKIDVIALSKVGKGLVAPMRFRWKNRIYTVNKIGLRHPVRDGRTLHHIYSCTDGTTFFRIRCDTEQMQFTLESISDGLPD